MSTALHQGAPNAAGSLMVASHDLPPLAYLASLDMPTTDDVVEAIVTWTHLNVGNAEIVAASERFYADNGKVFHDDSFYAARTSYFLDHFVFERPLASASERSSAEAVRTPFELFLAEARRQTPPLSAKLIDLLTWVGDFHHSIFQVVSLRERSMVLADVLTNTKITITAKPHETFRGLDKKHLLQGFVFKVEASHQLSAGLVLHPDRVGRTITRFIKQSRKDSGFSKRAVLARLASLQLRYLRHRHVDPKTLYQTELG